MTDPREPDPHQAPAAERPGHRLDTDGLDAEQVVDDALDYFGGEDAERVGQSPASDSDVEPPG